jgi:hypothetical protein
MHTRTHARTHARTHTLVSAGYDHDRQKIFEKICTRPPNMWKTSKSVLLTSYGGTMYKLYTQTHTEDGRVSSGESASCQVVCMSAVELWRRLQIPYKLFQKMRHRNASF